MTATNKTGNNYNKYWHTIVLSVYIVIIGIHYRHHQIPASLWLTVLNNLEYF